MFIIMDVVFHKDSMYFPKLELQGEYQKEIQTLDFLDYEYYTYVEVESSKSGNQDVGNLDIRGIMLDSSGNDS